MRTAPGRMLIRPVPLPPRATPPMLININTFRPSARPPPPPPSLVINLAGAERAKLAARLGAADRKGRQRILIERSIRL